ncbi:flagellar export protein FliJ [Maridesulfovibrio hydrothermalis]|uniref:Flagellar FliJ protein n=1 Tax=Maridesulfovibrio hydrothermalis AM13 = DSM 14728 TaxID=1121451 RepID=L0RB56_9BACT|nr:flagellar export protein FliJ [Maridesulfovibrio hydrothermalis]CCO22816.1 Flagellar export protein FliJ [Maridesulfovibrio hydrothermalis AM13 = DSM 14728]
MPKPYVFKLEKVLEFRKQAEEQASMALAQAIRLHQDQKKAVFAVEEKMAAHEKEKFKNITANDMWLWQQYDVALKADLSTARSRLKQLALNLQKCRTEAVKKSKDRKLLEKLKENQAKKYHEEENLKEQKEYDEMATIRFKSKDF